MQRVLYKRHCKNFVSTPNVLFDIFARSDSCCGSDVRSFRALSAHVHPERPDNMEPQALTVHEGPAAVVSNHVQAPRNRAESILLPPTQ